MNPSLLSPINGHILPTKQSATGCSREKVTEPRAPRGFCVVRGRMPDADSKSAAPFYRPFFALLTTNEVHIARAAADPARSERNPVKLSREGLLCGCFLAFAGPCHKGTRELYYPLTRASNALVLFLRKLLRNTTTAPYDGVCSTLLYHGCTTVLTVCHPRVAPRLTVPCILPGVYVSSTRRKWPCLASAASLRPCRGKCKTEPEAADAVRWAWGGRGPLSVSGAAVAAI